MFITEQHNMMSYKHFFLKTFAFAVFVIIGCCLSSCSEDEAGSSNESSAIISKLKSKKWVYNGYDVELLEQQRFSMYFINETCGITDFFYRFIDLGTSSKSVVTFTYQISGNKIVIEYEHGGRWEYYYVDNHIISDNGSEIYNPQELTQSDWELIKQHDPAEKDKEKQIQKNVNNNLSVTVKQSEGGWLYTFNTSALERLYPSSNIEYGVFYSGVCNKYKYCKKSYCSEHEYYVYAKKDGSKYSALVYPCDPNDGVANYEMYLGTYNVLTERLSRGESLSDSEKTLFSNVKGYLDDILDCDYDDTPFAKIDGKFYRLENFNISRCWYCHGFGFTYRKGTCSICKGSGK